MLFDLMFSVRSDKPNNIGRNAMLCLVAFIATVISIHLSWVFDVLLSRPIRIEQRSGRPPSGGARRW